MAQDRKFDVTVPHANSPVSFSELMKNTEELSEGETPQSSESGDIFVNAYNLYNTYDTSDRSRHQERVALYPQFPSGVVRFTVKGEEDTKNRYYMIVHKDVGMDDVAQFMNVVWHRRTPKLVLSVICSSRYFVPWENARFEEDFQEGIIEVYAANSTEMWILTDGMDIGLSKIIGDAALKEMTRRRNMAINPLRIQNVQKRERLPRLNIFGIAAKSSLVYADILTGMTMEGQIVENNGGFPAAELFDLNPDHSHFILMDDGKTPDLAGLLNFRLNLEVRFTKAVGKPRHFSTLYQAPEDNRLNQELESLLTPVIGLLVQGGPADIDHILWLLTKKIPVVVIQGSGLAADLVSFAYMQMQQRTDIEYLDTYIKAELMRRVSEAFPDEFANDDIARNLCRDKIIECVKLDQQDNVSYLTIVNCNSHGVRLTDLSKHVLTALFKSQAMGRHSYEMIQQDLQLTVDWNRPDWARSEIFNKYKLRKFKVAEYIVHMALIRPDREEFIKLFLEHGWLIHTYLNHKRLHNLFENPADKDFFVTVCLEAVIGKNVTDPDNLLCHNFVLDANCELNRLLYKCTGLTKLVNPYELSMNCLGTYITDKVVAERRATNTLVLWAALTSRYKLAKLLWKHTEEPMAVALVVSMILHNLATNWCKDQDMRKSVKHEAAEFGKLAVTMLCLSYEESSMYTFLVLSKELEDFNNRNVVELAKLGENKYFIAHTCCQKWLTERWYGNMTIRELDWGGQFKLPEWLKIYLSVFFLFPMFIWITFQPPELMSSTVEVVEDDDDEGQDDFAQEMPMDERRSSMMSNKSRKSKKKGLRNMLESKTGPEIPVWKQIYYLWTATVTKFWLSELLYSVYLMLITLGLILPHCGNTIVNIGITGWTTVLWMELIRRTIIKKRLYPEVQLTAPVMEIIVVSLFIMLMLGFRILTLFVDFVSFTITKFLLSGFLLFFYFRYMVIFLPISQELGPLLLSIIINTKRDFVIWLRTCILPIVAGGVAIHAVLYPSDTFGIPSVREALSRAIFGLFLTKIDDLEGDIPAWPSATATSAIPAPQRSFGDGPLSSASAPADLMHTVRQQPQETSKLQGFHCSSYYDDDQVTYCSGIKYENETIERYLNNCPHKSLLNYVVLVPYLLSAKLVFTGLLYGIFALVGPQFGVQGMRWVSKGGTQMFYHFLFIKCPETSHVRPDRIPRYADIRNVLLEGKRLVSGSALNESKSIEVSVRTSLYTRGTTSKVYNESMEIWRYQRYVMVVDFEERLVFPPPFTILCYIFFILKWIGQLIYRIVIRLSSCTNSELRDHALKVPKFQQTADSTFWKECINQYTDGEQAEKVEEERAKTQTESLVQLLEEMKQHRRLTQYLNDTVIQVETSMTNSHVLLEDIKHMIHQLDPATQKLYQERKKYVHTASRQSPYKGTLFRRFPVFDKFVPWEVPYDTYDPAIYSAPVTSFPEDIRICVDPDVIDMHSCVIDGVSVEINRTSWITVENEPVKYKMDSMNVPVNPMGRTGMRGRGKMWRFGPNHRIAAVVTRWRRKYSKLGFPLGNLLVDGKRVLECLVITHKETGERTLPGGNVYGKTSAYSVLCEEFLKGIFMKEDVEGSSKLNKDEMINVRKDTSSLSLPLSFLVLFCENCVATQCFHVFLCAELKFETELSATSQSDHGDIEAVSASLFFAQFSMQERTQHLFDPFQDPPEEVSGSGFSACILYRGYIDYAFNTDNAWRESEVWNFHYDQDDIFDERIQEREKMWQEVMPHMNLYGNQDTIVLEAARIHSAYS
ncbi:transient receptor potential cation channel subfamily M member-like 2 [Babylonia areolata]|uniref:transient receptor potential cation channel subfamily M member-like 2 n=1 Tax=Babylonia areolata TaxID=304850 RepID=UPI003FD3F9DD